jgi:hypothetical protein
LPSWFVRFPTKKDLHPNDPVRNKASRKFVQELSANTYNNGASGEVEGIWQEPKWKTLRAASTHPINAERAGFQVILPPLGGIGPQEPFQKAAYTKKRPYRAHTYV